MGPFLAKDHESHRFCSGYGNVAIFKEWKWRVRCFPAGLIFTVVGMFFRFVLFLFCSFLARVCKDPRQLFGRNPIPSKGFRECRNDLRAISGRLRTARRRLPPCCARAGAWASADVSKAESRSAFAPKKAASGRKRRALRDGLKIGHPTKKGTAWIASGRLFPCTLPSKNRVTKKRKQQLGFLEVSWWCPFKPLHFKGP